MAITGDSGPIGSDGATAGPLRLAGRFLAVPVIYTQVRYGYAGLALSVYDLASGRRFYMLSSQAEWGTVLLLEAVFLTPAGVAAYAYRDGMFPLRSRLVAWSGRRYDVARDGIPRPLDEGPAGSITSLRLAGATLTWLYDGVPRSATLARPVR